VDHLTDQLLRGREGDRQALEAFVRATQPEIWRLCRYMLGPDDADDVTQEVYLAAWRSLSNFRADSSARTWLFAIAHRTVWRSVRRRRRRSEIGARLAEPRGAGGGDPAEPRALTDLINHLDGDRRSAFVLTQLFGFSYAEVAEICKCPVGTIRSRVARAREELLGWVLAADQAHDSSQP
jgi:RNA polymerase sigma-70 factor (ECF subfamily)